MNQRQTEVLWCKALLGSGMDVGDIATVTARYNRYKREEQERLDKPARLEVMVPAYILLLALGAGGAAIVLPNGPWWAVWGAGVLCALALLAIQKFPRLVR